MAQSPDSAKENTILDLTHAIGDGLNILQDKLDNRFARGGKTEGEGKPSPINPNVLDEILQGLTADKEHLLSLIDFISAKVLPKIN